ncbi:hypothetical protein RJ55_01153 [Drechmeria coniospora]|nr:hypothetical protein RJ55_01153 [Drechmeria coniospora]
MNPAASRSSGSPDKAAVALRGASLAFQKQQAPAKPSPPSSNAAMTATAAATMTASMTASTTTTAGGGGSSSSTNGVALTAATASASAAAASEAESPAHQLGRPHQLGNSSPSMAMTMGAMADTQSPSFIAATLAAGRNVSPTPHAGRPRSLPRPHPRPHPNAQPPHQPPPQAQAHHVPVDSESIAPTGSLVSLFERGSHEQPALGRGPAAQRPPVRRYKSTPLRERPETQVAPEHAVQGLPPPLPATRQKAPQAQHATKASETETEPKPKPKLKPNVKPKPTLGTAPPQAAPDPRASSPQPEQPSSKPRKRSSGAVQPLEASVIRSTPELHSPKPVRLARPTLSPTVAPSPRADRGELPSTMLPERDPQKRVAPPTHPKSKGQPPTPPKARNQKLVVGRSSTTSRSQRRASTDAQVGPSAPVVIPSSPGGRSRALAYVFAERGRSAPGSASSSPVRDAFYRQHAAAAPEGPLHLDSLADAIMAGSLASLRLTPHSTGNTLPPSGLSKHHRSSPRLLPTLRQPQAKEEEAERQPKGHRSKLQRGKHAHHEGSRRRWRDELTERERKRYEAVWASNRGWLLEQRGDETDCVANVVVREIWRRSRLPEDELAEVWDLVASGEADGRRGRLSRQEFVVGMWLIDQRLRGRKLPRRVSDSVWGSANGVTVVRRPRPKGRTGK